LTVGDEVYIMDSFLKNKQNLKYKQFVDYRGTIRKIVAKDGKGALKDFMFFVELTHDQDDNQVPKDKTEFELRSRNGGGFQFLKGLDRHILNCLPAKQKHICAYTEYSRTRAQLKREKRALDAKIDAADQGGASKKPRPGDDGPAGGAAGKAAAP